MEKLKSDLTPAGREALDGEGGVHFPKGKNTRRREYKRRRQEQK